MKLSDEQFTAFWSQMDEQDRQEFTYLHGGTPALARFVCALDMLLVSGARQDGAKGTEREAYALAFDCTLEEAASKWRDAIKRDCVQMLLNRIRYRGRALFWLQVEGKQQKLINQIVDSAEKAKDIDTKAKVIKILTEYSKTIDPKEVVSAAERTKRGIAAGTKAALALDSGRPLTRDDAVRFLKSVRHELGTDFDSVLSEVQREALPS